MCYNEWSVIPKSNLCLDVCDSGTICAVVNLTHHRREQGPHYTMILDIEHFRQVVYFCTRSSIYMITSVPCRMSGGAARPLTSHVTKGRAQCGGTIISRGQRGGAIKFKNSRVQASIYIAARRLPLCVCRARQTARY